MSKGFLMENGDVVLNKDIQMTQGDDFLRQKIEYVINTNQGEWGYDVIEGINRAFVLRKNPDVDEIRSTIEEAVLRVDETLTLTNFKLSVDAKRHATITFTLIKPNGEELGVSYTYAD